MGTDGKVANPLSPFAVPPLGGLFFALRAEPT
jgi:hypothetical protein